MKFQVYSQILPLVGLSVPTSTHHGQTVLFVSKSSDWQIIWKCLSALEAFQSYQISPLDYYFFPLCLFQSHKSPFQVTATSHSRDGYILLVFKVSSTRWSLCWSANSAPVRKFNLLSCVCIRICGLIYNKRYGTTEAKCPLQDPPFKPLFISDSLETRCFLETMDSQHYLGKEWNKRKAYFCRDSEAKSSDRAFSYSKK